MAFFISKDLGLLCRLNSVIQKFHAKGSLCSLLNCSRSLGGSGLLMDANNTEGGSLDPAMMAGEPGGKGAPHCPGQSPLEKRSQGCLECSEPGNLDDEKQRKCCFTCFFKLLGCSIPRHSEAKSMENLGNSGVSVHIASLSLSPMYSRQL